jgi:hypothetical protein
MARVVASVVLDSRSVGSLTCDQSRSSSKRRVPGRVGMVNIEGHRATIGSGVTQR